MLLQPNGPFRRVLMVVVVAVTVCPAAAVAQDSRKSVVERADQLPAHSYPITVAPSKMLTDDAAFGALAVALRRDLEADLRDFDIRDKTTVKNYFTALQQIAFLDGRWDDGLTFVERIRALEDKPSARLLAGLLYRPLVASRRVPPAEAARTYAKALATELKRLPYDSVQVELKAVRGYLQTQSAGLLTGGVAEQFDGGTARTGTLPKDFAISLVDTRTTLTLMLPLRDETVRQLSTLIGAHKVVQRDIWAARDVSLDRVGGLQPVVAAVWDVGVDVSLFPGRTWTNANETPNNGIDDDANGYVDDVHGIAWGLKSEKEAGWLRPVPMQAAALDGFKHLMKGLKDLQAGLETAEADELRVKMAGLAQDEVKPFMEGLGFYGNYAHGTHVAGIAAGGNPAIRLLHVRETFDDRMVPPVPTLAEIEAGARATIATGEYLKQQGVRVVNMSFGGSASGFEALLAMNGEGGTPEERRVLARRYFDILRDAFRATVVNAPEILFIAAAGNSNSDSRFDEFVPGSFDFPNIMAVGAVDRAGQEAAFTSFGKVEVYANGVEVESVVPGGDRQKWSGTSMAVPQVANLAAKLFARYPALSVAQVRQLIIDGADVKQVNEGRTIRLLNEKASFALATRSGGRR